MFHLVQPKECWSMWRMSNYKWGCWAVGWPVGGPHDQWQVGTKQAVLLLHTQVQHKPNNQTTKSFTYGHFQQTSTTIKLPCAPLTNFVKKNKTRKQPNKASRCRPWTWPTTLAKPSKSLHGLMNGVSLSILACVKTPSVQWEDNRINFLNSDAAGCEGRLESILSELKKVNIEQLRPSRGWQRCPWRFPPPVLSALIVTPATFSPGRHH